MMVVLAVLLLLLLLLFLLMANLSVSRTSLLVLSDASPALAFASVAVVVAAVVEMRFAASATSTADGLALIVVIVADNEAKFLGEAIADDNEAAAAAAAATPAGVDACETMVAGMFCGKNSELAEAVRACAALPVRIADDAETAAALGDKLWKLLVVSIELMGVRTVSLAFELVMMGLIELS